MIAMTASNSMRVNRSATRVGHQDCLRANRAVSDQLWPRKMSVALKR
jgi:hypothetical protein